MEASIDGMVCLDATESHLSATQLVEHGTFDRSIDCMGMAFCCSLFVGAASLLEVCVCLGEIGSEDPNKEGRWNSNVLAPLLREQDI